ncbi:acyl-CoA dehydrogenase [Arenibaculum sp.]|jgi:alkylation response protein AidB-like acyl-CoA dehydrogenase|uniref:acyl-CoA dehydrogenase n=1 Tax=Arenibaculum sp. TaxID=2865862 RepID=UPI002E14F36A|nr:acyl-CoA dehydrogenase [Arenibaculum sp.]
MIPYAAPVKDMRFVLANVVGFDRIAALPGYEAAAPDLVDAALDEAAKLAAEVVAPLNRIGDIQGSVLENGVVRTPDGFRDAYRRYVDGGWNSVPFEPDYGGQGLPWVLATAFHEMWQSACMSFSLCPLLNLGAVELLTAHGSEEQKLAYLPKMISGEWTGTMNLTEPQAGSDLAQIRARAERASDGTYRIFGQKIYISFGEHDLTDNIVHLVLARLPDAPAGVKGISLFVVPKLLLDGEGRPGARNDLRCVSLEHKLGINASPTAVMAYGDSGGAVGYLVGEENRGLEYMFTMMNNARLNVGLQGVSIAERAYQQARDYARGRVQSKDLAEPKGGPVPIIRHPDVRRMLLSMRSRAEAGRTLSYYALACLDVSKRAVDAESRRAAQSRVDLLTPVVKAWCTDMGVEVASTGVQVHGGMGFIEETGAAQYYRDARISPIYEGTNGIQSNDLVFRKVARDEGAAARALMAEMRGTLDALRARPGDDAAAIADRLEAALATLDAATGWVAATAGPDPRAAAAGAVPYARLFGTVSAAWLMARSALAAQDALRVPAADHAFLDAKIASARFFCEHHLPEVEGLLATVRDGWRTVLAFPEESF